MVDHNMARNFLGARGGSETSGGFGSWDVSVRIGVSVIYSVVDSVSVLALAL